MVNFKALADTAGDMTPIPIGKVDAVIIAAEFKIASTGKPMWACTMRVQNGPSAGKTFYNNFVISDDNPKAVRAFFINMRNLGIPQEQIIGFGENTDALTRMLIGRQAIWTLTHRDYQGSVRENVERLDAHPSGPVSSGGGVAPAGAAPSVPSTPPIPQAQPAAPPVPAPIPAPQPVAAAPALVATAAPAPPF